MTPRLAFCLALSAGLMAAPAVRAAEPPKVPDGVTYEPDLEYSNPDNQHLMLDLARPSKGDGPFPAVLLIHGGGFRAGNRHGYDGLCMRLAQNGYVAATVEYRLAPKYQFPAAVYDCKAAVRWLRANAAKYHIDPARVGVAGGSAGGHLALFLGVTGDVKKFDGDGGNPDQSSKVDCVVSFYGPSDFTKSYGHSKDAAEVLPLFLGGDLEKEHRRHIEASPLYWVTPDALHPVHPRHQGRLRRLRTGRLDRGQAQGGRRGGGTAHHRGGRPRFPRTGRGEGRTGDDRVLRQAPQNEMMNDER